jgi:CubicO group peptidase (beta-lactamase class C family)
MSRRTRFSGLNLLVALILGTLALAGAGVRSMPAVVPPQKDLAADLEGFTAALAARDQFSGSVLLARHGQPLVRRGYGLADRTRRRPNTPDTPFMLSSVGKVFTAVTIAKLIEQKQLSFDTTLGALVPDYPLADARDHVTVGHLLTMSSGVQDLFRVPAFWSEIPTIGFETRLVNGVRTAGHRGSLAGSTNQLEFYPDLGYVLVVLGNTDSDGTQTIATHVRDLVAASLRR